MRRLLLGLIRDEMAGKTPQALSLPDEYAVLSGGWVAHKSKALDEVMTERFGNPQGYLGQK